MKYLTVNIITISIFVAIIVGAFLNMISYYYLAPLFLLYVGIIILGVMNIDFNFFFTSYCSSLKHNKKEIAISFDDGPHPEITIELLNLLNKYNTLATFFCIGKNAEAHPQIIKKINNNNHIIGNHSYNHSVLFDILATKKMQEEISKTNKIIKSIIGKTPLLFRPPFGITNPNLGKAINKTNMISIGWSLRPFDTVKNSNSVIAKLKSKTKAGDIVLFHDTNVNIVPVVEDYLIWLKNNNYKTVSIPNLLNINAYETNMANNNDSQGK